MGNIGIGITGSNLINAKSNYSVNIEHANKPALSSFTVGTGNVDPVYPEMLLFPLPTKVIQNIEISVYRVYGGETGRFGNSYSLLNPKL